MRNDEFGSPFETEKNPQNFNSVCHWYLAFLFCFVAVHIFGNLFYHSIHETHYIVLIRPVHISNVIIRCGGKGSEGEMEICSLQKQIENQQMVNE